MTFLTRLGLFLIVAVAGFVAWQWNAAIEGSREMTHLAVRQFQNDDVVVGQIAQASLTQQWWPLAWPGILMLLAAVMFWDDFERMWKRRETN